MTVGASMNEPISDARVIDSGAGTATAGTMLKAAREKRGLHIAALSASIKVPQRKLEALESDRYEELLDLTFTRALAQTICRTLKIDAQPVLDRLPQVPGAAPKLQHISNGLNAPFRERPGRDDPADWSWLGRPVVWGTLLVLIAAGVLAFLPGRYLDRLRGLAPVAPSASAAAPGAVSMSPSTSTSSVVEVLPSVPLAGGVATAAATSLGAPAAVEVPVTATPGVTLPAGSALLGLKAVGETWVEVQDARGQTLLSRKVAQGESLGLDGEVPLRLTIGNASGTQVTFRGRPVDLKANTEGNVARLQLN
jgi:cytoskeleton protein RodZ